VIAERKRKIAKPAEERGQKSKSRKEAMMAGTVTFINAHYTHREALRATGE